MDRINRVTREVKSHQEVCRLANASIPVGQDYGDWIIIQSRPTPEIGEGQMLVSAGVVEEDGQFYYGWSVEDADVTSYVPASVSRLQGLAQLHIEGVLEGVETYMASPERSTMEQLAWKNAQTFDRDSVLVQQIATVLGWDETKLNQVFIDADKIKI